MARTKVFTDKKAAEALELYASDMTVHELASHYECSDRTVRELLYASGVLEPKRGNLSSLIDAEEAARLYESGQTLEELGKRYGCSYMSVWRRLVAAGVEIRKPGSRQYVGYRPDELDARILELHEQGMSDYEISEHLGISRYTVNKRLRKTIGYRGKGSNSHNGGIAYAAKMHRKLIARLEALPDVDVVDDGNPVKVRCKKCGTVYDWNRDMWRAKERCPGCREAQREQARLDRESKEVYRVAAREWRLSVPHICKECGQPFYSEHENAMYCCESCRKRSKNRKAAMRRKRRGGSGSNLYKRRMRIKVTKSTYDRTVTLSAVYKKFRGRCCMCGCKTVRTKKYDPKQATLDHVIALANYGTHTWDNVQLLCNECNVKKGVEGQMRLSIA